MSYIESFLVRRMNCRVPTNNLNRIFQAVPGQRLLDVPVAEGLHQLLSADNRFWPDDDRRLRAELLRRLNELKGADVPEGKLDLRPSFRLSPFWKRTTTANC